jgi:hypothetical protein
MKYVLKAIGFFTFVAFLIVVVGGCLLYSPR